jgi:hypothetical protein
MGNEGDPSPKKSLDISIFLEPVADVSTSIGKVYLYPLRTSDIGRIGKLQDGAPILWFREFLPCIASLHATTKFEAERLPLTSDEVTQLADDEVERLAEAYAFSSALQTTRLGGKEGEQVPRHDGETAAAYVDRLLRKDLESHLASAERLRKLMLAPASSLFDAVRSSSSALTQSLKDYEKLASVSVTPRTDSGRLADVIKNMDERHARQVSERAEELEMVRLTGQMTAQSAATLRDLADVATVMLERFDARDQKSDKDTRRQLRIAVGSVIVSAVLALFALIVAVWSFTQDKRNNEADGKWQSSLLSAISESNHQQRELREGNAKLRARIEALERAGAVTQALQSPNPAGGGSTSDTPKTRALKQQAPPPPG